MNFFASIVLILILGGFLIFEYTDLSIFISYEIDGDGVDGYDLNNTLWRIFGGFGPFEALAEKTIYMIYEIHSKECHVSLIRIS